MVIEKKIPVFQPIGSICQNSAGWDLPPISDNNISGTWSPSRINTATAGITPYTFTPSELCASAVTINVEITQAITPTFVEIEALCQNSVAPLLPINSLNGITGQWNPAVVNMTANGSYTFTPDLNQCANPVTINIVINPVSNIVINSTVCGNSIPFTWNGQTITGAGTYSYTTLSSAGCDSTTTLNLLVSSTINVTINSTVCANAVPFNWNGQTITGAGTYTYTTLSSSGCDSTTTLNLTVYSLINVDD